MGGIDSAQNWHGNIGHNYVGKKAEGLRHQGRAIRCGSHYVKLRLQKPSCGFTYGWIVIRQQYSWSDQSWLHSDGPVVVARDSNAGAFKSSELFLVSMRSSATGEIPSLDYSRSL